MTEREDRTRARAVAASVPAVRDSNGEGNRLTATLDLG
jgi:hypothetical protein